MFLTLVERPADHKAALTVPVAAYDLFTDLDVRGFVLLQTPNGSLRVGSKTGLAQELSDSDRDGIKRFKPHLLALVAYCQEDH